MSLALYYEEILKTPLLSTEEEMDLFVELTDQTLSKKRRQEIRDQILKANLRFVFKQAKFFSKGEVNLFEELISAGNEGLVVALDKYDHTSGYKFLTYAGWWVRQRILNHMASQRLVALPIWRQQLSARIQKAIDANNEITFDELKALFSDVPEKDLRELFDTQFLTFYIEDLTEDSAFEINPIEDQVNKDLDAKKLREALQSLPELTRDVMEKHYGIFDGDEWKASKIAKSLGKSVPEVKGIIEQGMVALREQFLPGE